MRQRFLTVPKNNQGTYEYNYGIAHTDNMIEKKLSEEEFYALYHNGVFKQINDRCNLMIDDYESEIISCHNIEKCIDVISLVPGVFYEMAEEAKKYNTALCLDF